MRWWPFAAIALAGGLALGIALGSGPDPATVPTVDDIAARMMSPFCPGLTVEECPSDQSSRLRSQIQDMIDAGTTNAEMDRWIVDNFGESALARPASPGAWIVPPLAGMAGLAAILIVVRRRPRTNGGNGGKAGKPGVEDLSRADEARFQQDFREFRRGSE